MPNRFGPDNMLEIFDAAGNKASVALQSGSLAVSTPAGAAFSPIGGGFGANTTINLPNNLSANVPSLNVQTSLTNNTSGSEASQWVIRLLKGGAQAPGGGFGVDTYTMAPDTFTLNSTSAKLALFSDCGVARDVSTAALLLSSNGGDVVQGAGATLQPTGLTFGFMQILGVNGFPTATPNRMATDHFPVIFDKPDSKAAWHNGTNWLTDGDNFKLGAQLTDGSLSKDVSNGGEFVLPPATLTAGTRVLTLAVTGSPATGQIIRVTRQDATANIYVVKDDAATTLLTMPVSVRMGADFKFNGTHFVLDRFWTLN